jgi:hypothetical protein
VQVYQKTKFAQSSPYPLETIKLKIPFLILSISKVFFLGIALLPDEITVLFSNGDGETFAISSDLFSKPGEEATRNMRGGGGMAKLIF